MLGRKIVDHLFRISVIHSGTMRRIRRFVFQSLEVGPYRIFELHFIVFHSQTGIGTMIIRFEYLGLVPEIVDSDCPLAGIGSDVEDEIITYELIHILSVTG